MGVISFFRNTYPEDISQVFRALQFCPQTIKEGETTRYFGTSPFFDDVPDDMLPPKYELLWLPDALILECCFWRRTIPLPDETTEIMEEERENVL